MHGKRWSRFNKLQLGQSEEQEKERARARDCDREQERDLRNAAIVMP